MAVWDNFSDLIFGKPEGGRPPDPLAPYAKKVQGMGLALQKRSAMEHLANRDIKGEEATQALYDQESTIRQPLREQEDLRRRLQNMVARKTMGMSTGINADLAQTSKIGQQVGAIRNQTRPNERNLILKKISDMSNAGSKILGSQNAPIDFNGQPAQRGPGILPLLTAGAGAYMGGPAGAQVGLGVGQYYQGYQNY